MMTRSTHRQRCAIRSLGAVLLVVARAGWAAQAVAVPAATLAANARPARVPVQAPAFSASSGTPAATTAQIPAAQDAAEGRIRIQLVSRDQVDVSSEISAKIASLPFREGDAFRAGQTLVSLDCSLYSAQLRKSQADADGARDLLDVNQKLLATHSIGELDVQQAQAKQKASAAEVAYMQATVHRCMIAAPFDGRVSRRNAAPQQYTEAGKPILTIVDTSHLELRMIVPSKWLVWLKPGHALTVQVDEVGKSYSATVARIGARVDPVSQTVDVTAVMAGRAAELLPGMSGWATFAAR